MRLPLKALLLAGVPLLIMGGLGVWLLTLGDTVNGRSMLAIGVIIASVSGASVIYQLERWNLPKQTLVHSAVMAVTVLPAQLLSGWFDLGTPSGWLFAIGSCILIGVVLWSVFYGIFLVGERRRARSAA